MNTNKLKSFAKAARIILLNGVKQRIAYWGFDKKGNATEELTSIEGGYMFRESVFNDPTIPKKWHALKAAIKRHTIEDIIEEAAYTWFNRLIAIKVLEKNNYMAPVYEFVSEQLKDPAILQDARNGEITKLRDDEKKLLNEYLVESKDEEAFALLLTAFCRNQKLTNRIFGHIDDYTELLLPNNLLSGGGIIEHINSTGAIVDEDYKEVELIGWLYQFYISDKKDEVFAGFKNKKKARPEDIPAATQIFTPKWIVKYMVENTVGRIWLDLHPESPIRTEMKYFVEPADKENYKPEPIITSVTELTLMDPGSGSGHILVEGFDLLLKMYLEEGYTTKNAVESIIRNNLYGLDIDDRAAQLANFAVLLKAAKYYPAILASNVLPNIYSFPEGRELPQAEVNLFLDKEGMLYAPKLKEILDLLQQGKNLGSVIKIEMTKAMRQYVLEKFERFEEEYFKDELDLAEKAFWINLRPFIQVILLLSSKYSSVVANPPYMGQKNMNESLKEYVNAEYPISKSDLFSVFMEVCWNLLIEKTFMAMINQHSWMFLSSFEKLRDYLLTNYQIESMLHLGARTFEEISGEVVQSTTFVLRNRINNGTGVYHRLVEGAGKEKEKNFFDRKNLYTNISQSNFSKIPGSPIAYWASGRIFKIFSENKSLGVIADPRLGMSTNDNDRFLKLWYEVSLNKISLSFINSNHSLRTDHKWFPYNKGGEFRRWYGNNEYVINWASDGKEVKDYAALLYKSYTRTVKNIPYFFKRALTWSLVSSSGLSFRLIPSGYVIGDAGPTCYPSSDDENYILSIMNSKLVNNIASILNPTMNFTPGAIKDTPIIFPHNKEIKFQVESITKECLLISIKEWDSHETSWDFKKSELLRQTENHKLQFCYNSYSNYWNEQFFQLHKNEEELNRIFIDIYGLKEELTPEVPLKDITILQDETYINESNELVFKKDEIIKQFISYAVGCMMGRYSLDKEGLILANQGDTIENYKQQIPNPKFMPDEDGIIPMLGNSCNFSDDVFIRFKHFLEVALSTETLTENINFIQECLDMDLEKFLTEKFWQYHCKMYQKKPIYWLFSSPKGAFKVLVYMHRMNKFTVQKIRNNYLLKHLSYLRNEIAKMEKSESNLSKAEAKQLDKMRSDEIECREYEKLIKDYADKQIEFDLDDGVTVNYAKFEGILAVIK